MALFCDCSLGYGSWKLRHQEKDLPFSWVEPLADLFWNLGENCPSRTPISSDLAASKLKKKICSNSNSETFTLLP